MARSVMDQLAEHGEVRRGTLGIFVQDLTSELAGAFGLQQGAGVLISEIVSGSSADSAGLIAGDVITVVNGTAVESPFDLQKVIRELSRGDTAELAILREAGLLRDRREDIPELVGHFLRIYNEQNHCHVPHVEPKAMEALVAYDWPGNVRELEKTLRRALVLAQGDSLLRAEHLPEEITGGAGLSAVRCID